MSEEAARLREFVEDHLAKTARDKGLAMPPLQPDSNLLELGILDSLEFVQMLLALEEAFGLELDLAELDPAEFTTLEGLVVTALANQTAA
jgi:acyl carrier protein